ncbi:MAG TPA: phosphotransferase [Gemmataceae bacterium]|nr:phosphotransferase [Gemmataceae bacterium]
MTQAWTAECSVSADLARSLIEAQFPQMVLASVEPFGAGWDNTAFLVNDTLVFRFPRRQIAVPLLEAEARLLPVLAERLPLPIPVPTFVGPPTASYPWPFGGYPLLPGRTACSANLDDEQRQALAAPLARFLATLHTTPAAWAAHHGAGPDPIERLDIARRLPRLRELLAQFAAHHLVEDVRPLTALADAAPAVYVPRADTLVHGDLYVRHLLVNEDKRLAGVIDWGDIHLGDPAADLMVAHSFLPPTAHDAFRAAYGQMDSTAWNIARLRALWHTANVLSYAQDVGDVDLLREGQRGLRYLALT